jgi:transposase InsO family protein
VCQAYAQRSTVSGLLHPIPPLGPFEKWGIDLMGPLPMTKRGHRFIVVATDYLTKFAEVRALKSSVKQEVARFLYERVFTRFGAPLEIVSDNGPQFLSEVVENMLACLAVKHKFTTMYKPGTNGLVERTNRTLCSMLAKEADSYEYL